MRPDTAHLVSSILNAGWMVRHYARGARTSTQRLEREQAILRMGVTIRDAFNKTEDYELLLVAVVDALRPRDDPPF